MKLVGGKAARFYCTLPQSYTERWVMSSQGKKGWDTLKNPWRFGSRTHIKRYPTRLYTSGAAIVVLCKLQILVCY